MRQRQSACSRLASAFLLASALLCLLPNQAAAEVEHLVIGNAARPWAEWGVGEAVDDLSVDGWIQPRRTTLDSNILQQLWENGQLYAGQQQGARSSFRLGLDGRIWSPNIPPGQNSTLLQLVNGRTDSLSLTYFNRLVQNANASIIVDLGIAYPVSQVLFYPLDFGIHADLFLKGYELSANDGAPENVDDRGDLIFTLLDAVPNNFELVAKSEFALQYLRYIKLTSTSPQPFELDQLEIRGQGHVRRGVYTTHILDLGDVANWGRLVWHAVQDSGASIAVQSRVGRDGTTLIYNQINELGAEEALSGATDEENKRTYDRLPSNARGSISADLENWTPWSTVYQASGQTVFSDGPGQFVQLRATLETTVPAARVQLDSLGFEFAQPVLGQRIVAAISPRQQVELGFEQSFTYTLRADIGAGDTGFDRIEVFTPAPAALQQVHLGQRILPASAYEVSAAAGALIVQLLDERIVDNGTEVRLVFVTKVSIYGTVFGGRVWASWEAEALPQQIEEEHLGTLRVRGAVESLGRVLDRVAVVPSIFTPNGDGVNDAATISFQLFQVIGAAPLQVRVYDLTGRPVVTLLDRPEENGAFTVAWDGRDGAGQSVLPGLYVYRVLLQGDADDFVRFGTVGVAY